MANDFNVRVGVTAEVDKAKVQSEINKQSKNVKLNIEANLELDKNILNNRINTYLKQNTKLGNDFQNKLKDIQSQISRTDKTQLNNLAKEFRQVSTEAASMGQTGKNVFDQFKTNIGQFLNFFYGAGSVVAVIGGLRNIINEVTDVNSSMISLKKVTQETDSTYEKFLVNTAQKAKELGASISDLVESTADFARLGYSLKDASMLSEVATLYKNVGDGLDIGQATQSIISTMKAFDIVAQDSMSIIDKYNEVGNNFSISSAGIGDALQRSAAALVEAGNTIDESIALTVAANNVVQDPEAVGTMWKTVSMRIRGAKTELEGAGLEIDGMVDSTSTLRDEIKSLTGGFDIMIDDSTFKSTYDIILGISKVYDKLSDTSQANILEMLAGKRQGNQLAAALNNAEDLVKVLETSQKSSGSALSEQEAYTKGIQYSMDRMKASLQELSTTTLDSSVIKWFVDFANGIVNATNSVGGLVPVLTTLGVTVGITKIAMNALLSSTEKHTIANLAATVSQYGLSTAIKDTAKSVGIFMATNPIGWIAGITVAIAGLFALQDALTTSLEEQQKKTEKLQTEYDELETKLSSMNSELKTTVDRIDELNAKDSLTIVEQDELDNLKETNTLLESQIRLLQQQSDIKNRETADSIAKEYQKDFGEEYQSLTKSKQYSANGTTYNTPEVITQEEYVKELISEYERLNKMDKSLMSEDDLTKLEKYKTSLVNYGVEFNDYADRYKIDDETSQSWRDFATLIDKTLNPAEYKQTAFNELFNSKDFAYAKSELEAMAKSGTLDESVITSNEKYKTLLTETGATASEVVSNIKALSLANEEVATSTYDSETAIKALNDALTNLSSSDKALSDLKTMVKDFGAISMDTITNLSKEYPQLTDVLNDYLSGVASTADVINGLTKIYQNDMKNWQLMILNKYENNEEFLKQVGGNSAELINKMKNDYSIDLSNNKSYFQSKMDIINTYLGQAGGAWLKYYDIASGKTQNLAGLSAGDQYYISKQATLANQALATFNQGLDFSGIESTFDTANGDFKTDKATEAEKKRQEAIQKVKDDFAKEDDANKFLLDTGKMDEATYYEKLKALNKKYFEDKKDFLAEDRQNQVAYYKWDKEQAEKSVKEKLKLTSDATDRILSLYDKSQTQSKNIGDSYTNGSDEQIKAYSDGLASVNQEISYINKQITKLNKMKIDGLFKDNEDEYVSQLKTLQDALYDTTSAAKTFTDAMAESAKSQQEEISDYFEKQQEKVIKSLEDERKAYDDIIDAQKEILDLKEKQRDYENSIAKQTKEISTIESRMADLQLAANSGDTKASAELRKLDEERAKKKDELAEDQHDHEVDLQQTALDKAKDEYDKLHEDKLSALEEEHKKQIDDINDIYNNIISLISNSANYLDTEFGTKLQGYLSQLNSFGIVPSDDFVNGIKGGQAQFNAKEQALSVLQNASGTGKGTSELNSYVKSNFGGKQLSYEQMAQLASIFGFSGVTAESIKNDTITKNIILEQLKRLFSGATYSDGGIVKASSSKGSGLLSDLLKSLGEDKLIGVRDEEGLMTKSETKVFKYDFIPTMNKFMTAFKPTLPDMSNIVTNNNSPNIQVTIPIAGTADAKTVSALNLAGNNIAQQVAKAIIDVKRTK